MLKILPFACLFSFLVPVSAVAHDLYTDDCLYVPVKEMDQEVGLLLDFYSEKLSIAYDPSLVLEREVVAKESEMVHAYRSLEGRQYRSFLNNLQKEKDRLVLNDWLYYQLLRDAVYAFYPSSRPVAREMTIWFLLSKSGYDTRITYREGAVGIYVYTKDEIFEAPLITDQDRTYVNLTGLATKKLSRKSLYMLEYTPNKGGKPFSFALDSWPRFAPKIERRPLRFQYDGNNYELMVDVDRNIAEIMDNYPYLSEAQYLSAPLSPTLKASLLPQLSRLLVGKGNQQKLELLVSVTRSGFLYKEDKAYFGKSKPMVADEVFCYPYSDCEDRSALFQGLVRELLDWPTIAIAFSDHLSVGVAVEGVKGDAIRYKGRLYVFCDPTGPANSSIIGEIPEGYQDQSFDIVYSYK